MSGVTKEDEAINDIYGDLDLVKEGVRKESATLQNELEEMQKKVENLEKELSSLKQERLVWAKQRCILIQNLGTVLKTAQVEVSRKDKEISRLRNMLNENNQCPSHGHGHGHGHVRGPS